MLATLPSIHTRVMEPGTIDPAALNAPASTIAPNLLSQPNPRGTKRNRSPDGYGGAVGQVGESDDNKASKRTKSMNMSASNASTRTMSLTPHAQAVQTPRIKTESLPLTSPSQTSPHRSTPGSATKTPVVKALPTVRDHTTDQLGPEGDEYIPREIDPEGETKVSKDGYPLDGRKYRCRTFQVPNRGEKLFMLATECARVLSYRDSYLLFNKNRSLYKIIANQQEKDNLIHQEILPYSYRSRQIAIVTARSMFRQFGARLIESGRRVRDDYWEAKARKQGFTEDDAAGEKRPGAAKAREAAAAEASHNNAMTTLPQGEIIYNTNGIEGQPPGLQPTNLAPLPMIHLSNDDPRASGYGGVIRPRQEMTGPPYQDRTQPSNPSEILGQATQAAEFNKQIGVTRKHRAAFLDNYWTRPHEQPALPTSQPEQDINTVSPQHLQSPQAVAGGGQPRISHDPMTQSGPQMMPQAFSQYPNQQNPMASPVQNMPRSLPQSSMHQSSPSMGMGAAQQHRQTPSYTGYPSNQMWQTPVPQPSPLSQTHPMSHYGQQQQQQQQQQHQNQMPPPQMPGQSSMGYGQMNTMANPAFGGMNRSMYQPSPSPQQFGMQTSGGQQPGMQGWTQPGNMPQYGQGFQ